MIELHSLLEFWLESVDLIKVASREAFFGTWKSVPRAVVEAQNFILACNKTPFEAILLIGYKSTKDFLATAQNSFDPPPPSSLYSS